MLSWQPTEISAVERACNLVAQALLNDTEQAIGSSIACPGLVSSPCGSFPLRSSIGLRGGIYHADVCFELPEQLCSTHDVEGGRYLKIRADIMARVALPRLQAALRSSAVELLTTSVTSSGAKHIIRVTIPAAVGRKSCVIDVHARPRHAGSVNSTKGQRRNPQYTALVVEDLVMVRIATACADIVQRCPAFAVAAQLLRKWAAHSGVLPPQDLVAPSSSVAQALSGGLNFFSVVTAPMLVLWHQGTIAATSSNVDGIVRAVWIHWAQLLQLQETVGGTDGAAAAASTSMQMFLPNESHLNVFHRAAAVGAADSITSVAEAAQQALTGGSVETILSTLPGRSIYERYDAVVRLTTRCEDAQQQQNQCKMLQAVLKTALSSRVSAIVAGNATTTTSSSPLNNNNDCDDDSAATQQQQQQQQHYIVVGLRFISEAAARSRLFRGPTIDDAPGGQAFSELWGADRVTTRQFGDGSISRCVLLPDSSSNFEKATSDFADPAGGCRAICDAVHLLAERHLEKATPSTAVLRAELCGGCEVLASLWTTDPALGAGSVARDPEPMLAMGRAAAVEDLREHINIIAESSLPCKISGVEFLSSAERGTDPFPPLPHLSVVGDSPAGGAAAAASAPSLLTASATISPIQLVVQIEDKKHRVPDNLDAIATMKSVVLAQLATELSGAKERFAQLAASGGGASSASSVRGKKHRVTPQEAVAASNIPASGGSKMTVHCSKLFADVLHEPSGYVFRVFVLLERELLVLQQMERAAEAASISRVLVWGQRHAEFMRGVIAQRPSVAGACRLLRRWVSAMCLADYVPLEVSELIVAYVSNTSGAASSSSTGGGAASKDAADAATSSDSSVAASSTYYSSHTLFLASLRLLAFFPFQTTPLVFPECDADKAALAWGEEQRRQQQQTEAQQGNTVALRAMFVAAPYTDPNFSPFTESTPRRGVFQCLVECARVAWERFAQCLAAENSVAAVEAGVASLFSLDTAHSFNFAVPLTEQAVSLFAQQQQKQQQQEQDSSDSAAAAANIAPRFVPSMCVSSSGQEGTMTEEESRRVLTRATDQNALLSSVRDVRRTFRDRCMIFYDDYNPSQLNGVRFGATLHQGNTSTTASVANAVAKANPGLFQAPRITEPVVTRKKAVAATTASAGKKKPSQKKGQHQQQAKQHQKKQQQPQQSHQKKKPVVATPPQQQKAPARAATAAAAVSVERKRKTKRE